MEAHLRAMGQGHIRAVEGLEIFSAFAPRALGVWRTWESQHQLSHVSDGNDEAGVIPRHWSPVGFGGVCVCV